MADWRVIEGDCVEQMAAMAETSVDAVVCDPPYLLTFMGRTWDHAPSPAEGQAMHRRWAGQAFRVLKPGGHLLAFGGTRTYHRLACAIEDAGFEIRDTIAWMYGSGFPKSLDVSKAIDAAAGAEREDVYEDKPGVTDNTAYGSGLGVRLIERRPATPDAERWQGWGTALKPAHEPVVVARKPLAGTVAANVLAHGTGALNVDGCRIGTPDDKRAAGTRRYAPGTLAGGTNMQGEVVDAPHDGLGRWPANVVLDPDYGGSGGASRYFYVAKASSAERNAGLDNYAQHGKICACQEHRDPVPSPARVTSVPTEADASDCSTVGPGSSTTDPSPTASRSTTGTATRPTTGSTTSNSSPPPSTNASTLPTFVGLATDGSDAAPSAANGKPPTPSTTTSAERDGSSTDGADRATLRESSPTSSSAVCADCGGVIEGARRNVHPLEPTVKPIDLMRWLVRLVGGQPGSTILDPFAGSGTTGIAAALEGFRFVGIEREAEYAEIARARIAWWSQHPDGVEIVKALEAERARTKVRESGQESLFG